MRIEHIAMYVSDLERTRLFFEKYFGAVSGSLYNNTKTGLRSYFLSFDDGSRLEIMNRPDVLSGDKAVDLAGYDHIAFSVGSRKAVDEMTEILRSDGFRVISGPRVTGDGYYESCILDGEGNRIEITE